MDGNRSFNPLWVEAYRPRKVADTILPDDLKALFQQSVDSGSILNMTASGSPGVGKTTVLKAMVEELGADLMFINASLKGNIDTLRNEIQEFASSMSLSGKRKYVILDEADKLTQAMQDGLRGVIEQYSRTTGFLLTCNRPHLISDAILSRAPLIEFKIPGAQKPKVAAEFLKRVEDILTKEGVEYDRPTVIKVVSTCFPDFRKTLGVLQHYAKAGPIDQGILAKLNMTDISELLTAMKAKNFTGVRKWVGENADQDATIYRRFYDKVTDLVTVKSVPALVLTIAEYDYRTSFVADREINMAACLCQIMLSVEFK